MMSSVRISTLSNGLRVITDYAPHVHSVAVGLWVGVGTRYEDMRHNGAAHMVEHMLFKGTNRRSARDIAVEAENVGAYMNAYTGKEITNYYMHAMAEHLPDALDILADIYQHSTLPEDEIIRERQVILQEIGMSFDTPDDIIFDNYYETAYPGQAIGAPILGRAQHISRMDRDTLTGYIRQFYTPTRTVIAAAGALDHDDFVARVEKLFNALPPDAPVKNEKAMYEGGEHRQIKDLEQAHIVLGFQGLSRLDDDYYAAQVLSTLLGGGMSSRLFQEIREKRGLVYSIYSFHTPFIDDGQFGIYAGTGPKDLSELIPVVADEIGKVIAGATDEETARAKAQLKAGTLMAQESMATRAEQQAKNMHYRGKLLDIHELVKKIDSISAADVRRVAARIFSSRPTVASLGPIEGLETFDQIAARFSK
jgi:predicted Zn-dependent peptidase